MELSKFEEFERKCSGELPDEIRKILKKAQGKEYCAIGFVTTDDFYGCYLTWDYSHDINKYYDWENGLEPQMGVCGNLTGCVGENRQTAS